MPVFYIEKFAKNGACVSKDYNIVTFIDGTLPGEVVEAVVCKKKKNYRIAECRKIIQPSPLRCPTSCRACDSGCGGCDLRYISPTHALPLKAQAVWEEIVKLSKYPDLPKIECKPLDAPEHSRCRATLHFDGKVLGFYKKASHSIVRPGNCPVLHKNLQQSIVALERSLIGSRCTKAHICCDSDERIYLCVDAQLNRETLEKLNAIFAGIVCPDRDCGDVYVKNLYCRANGEFAIFHKVGDFSQANREANEYLHAFVHETFQASGARHVVDFYAGSGNFSLLCALAGAESVTAVEYSQDAAKAFRLSAQTIPYYRGKLRYISCNLYSDFDPAVFELGSDFVIADPPRVGLSALLLEKLLSVLPENIVYVSCEPACFARDLAALKAFYDVKRIAAADMFPYTSALEVIAHLKKR